MGAAIGIIGLVLGGFGTAQSAIAGHQGAANEKRQFLLAKMFSRRRAADSLSRGGNLAARALGEADRTRGAQTASTAGRGFEIGVGTAGQITAATDLIGSIDALTIRENARREAQGHLVDAYSAGQQAKGVSVAGATVAPLISGASLFAQQLDRRLNA